LCERHTRGKNKKGRKMSQIQRAGGRLCVGQNYFCSGKHHKPLGWKLFDLVPWVRMCALFLCSISKLIGYYSRTLSLSFTGPFHSPHTGEDVDGELVQLLVRQPLVHDPFFIKTMRQ